MYKKRKYIRKPKYISRKIITKPVIRKAIKDVNKLKKDVKSAEVKEFIAVAST